MSNIEDLEEKRKEHGINKTIMGELVYNNPGYWGMAVSNKHNIYDRNKKKAEFVFEYHDKHGIVPEPREVPK